MSTRTPSVGIDHPTVVPTNFDPEGRDGDPRDPVERDDPDGDTDESGAGSDTGRRA
ncbi:hypothetical protein [Halorubrum sp. HHNYT27]|uniref:hypothetical protein n=1 Tax=Halorubrum sp. HHNYT27 TaxID=3402275 RepID=UPI003EBDA4CE